MKFAFGDIAVVVSDAKASARFWTDKVGFDLRDDDGHWVTVAAPGSSTLIHLCENGKHEDGNSGIGFEVADVAAAEKLLVSKGVKFTKPTEKTQWGAYAMFADPDGNEFWLNENPGLARAPRKAPARKAAARRPAKKASKKAQAASSRRKR